MAFLCAGYTRIRIHRTGARDFVSRCLFCKSRLREKGQKEHFPLEVIMPVRKVSNRGGNIIGSFPPQIKGEKVRYESTIERDLVYFFKFDPTVITYHAQPMVITGTDAEGNTHTYTPDFLAVRTDRKEIIECKPEALINSSHAQQQIAIGQEWAANNNHEFSIFTDTTLLSR